MSKFLDYSGNLAIQEDYEGNTCLHLAVATDCIKTVDLLLNSKVEVNSRNKRGFTAFHFCAKLNNNKMLEHLLQGSR